jgi:hypothetical protein
VEQQSPATLQGCASWRQTGGGSCAPQTPPVQLPVQHCSAEVHAWPCGTQQVGKVQPGSWTPQVPEAQLPVQHSTPAPHASPKTLQQVGYVHVGA